MCHLWQCRLTLTHRVLFFLPSLSPPFCSERGCPSTGFWPHKQEGGSATQRKPLGPDSITVSQGDLYPTPCSGPPSVARTHGPQCRRSAGAMLSGLRPHRVGGTLLWSSIGPMWRPSLEEGQENREKGPEAQSSVSAATSKCGS